MKKRSSIYILFFLIVSLTLCTMIVVAQEVVEYVVKPGDTQWSIAEEKLKNPYDWPKVWIANPEVKNPDLIYPGQRIKIPISLVKESVKKEIHEGEVPEKQTKESFKGIKSAITPYIEEREFYTVQLGSFPGFETAERAYNTALRMIEKESLDYLRIEVVKGYHTVRVGRFESYENAKKMLRFVTKVFPGAIILKAYIKEERIKKLYTKGQRRSEKKKSPPAEVVALPVKKEKKEVEKEVPPKAEAEVVEKPLVEARTKEGLIPLNIPFETIKKRFEEKEKAELRKKMELLGRRKKERPPTPVTGKDEITKEGLTAFNVKIKEEAKGMHELIKRTEKADIAVLPFENLSDNIYAVDKVMPLVRKYLEERGVKVLDEVGMRAFMVENRIRQRGSFTKKLAERLKQEYSVSYVMVGSIITFKDSSPVPKLGLLGRVINSSNGNIVWTNFASATGIDTVGFLGLGRITDIDKLIPVVLEKFLSPLSLEALKNEKNDKIRIAVLPFRNATAIAGAGKIAAYMFIDELSRVPGIQPLEFGDIREEVVSLNMREIGELSYSSIEELSKKMNIDMILLGTVEEYKPSSVESLPPKVLIASRVIDARSKRLLWLDDEELNGDDEIKILDIGKLRSVDMVAHDAIRKIIKRMEESIW